MSQLTVTPAASQQAATPALSHQTARLLTAGIVAGPLFLVVWALQAFTRDGFDPGRHPLSLLSLGDLGWIQIANFVVTGALFVACAVGLRRVLHPGPGGTWGPRLVGAVGAGLMVAGVFVTDAGAGFPAGAPAGAPEMSWHGALHDVGYVVVTLSWTTVCLVFRGRFAALGQRGWARACVAIVVAALVLSGWPDLDSFSIRIVISTAVQFGLVAAVAARLRRGLLDATSTYGAQ
ncbi:MAG TPA: DUF998 domain-containing protein [Actinophytocola sp.]|jgi:hypothetical protein|uniref:DUF998 domain-containing protein n=1 Tax=Actinophytocola sp. TaxID=1872138 RepID=UPI002E046763|nr:DUF998 domain-containing protein [Actinophytocola sp.]